VRLALDSYCDDDDDDDNNNNNKNKGIINLSFQYNTHKNNTESYVTFIRPAYLCYSVVLHANCFFGDCRGLGVVDWVKMNC